MKNHTRVVWEAVIAFLTDVLSAQHRGLAEGMVPSRNNLVQVGKSHCMWKIVRGAIFYKKTRLNMPVQSPKYANEPALVALGNAIRQLRLQQDVSQEELAHRAAVDRSYMSSVERGMQNPGVMLIVKIAAALEVPASKIFALADI